MKKINVLGKKLYVLTKDEVYKSYADPVYFIYEHQKQTLEQVLNKLNSILVTCTTQELHITCEEKWYYYASSVKRRWLWNVRDLLRTCKFNAWRPTWSLSFVA